MAASITSGPPMTRDSLLASARVLPAARVASVAVSPAEPVIALSTTSQASPASSAAASGPATMRGSRVFPCAQPRRCASAYRASWRSWTAVARVTPTTAALRVQHLLSQQLDLSAAGGQPDDAELAPAGRR